MIADDRLSARDRADRGSHVGCIAGALSKSEAVAGLAAAGSSDVRVTFTHEVADDSGAAFRRPRSLPRPAALRAGYSTFR